MATLLFYFPGATREIDLDLKTMRLDDALHPSRMATPVARDGPDGGAGLLMAPGPEATRPRPLRHDPEAQTWREAPEGYWVGYVTSSPPRPAELERPEFIRGMPVDFCDGHKWTVPVVRSFWGETNLPQKLNIGPNYEPVKEILPRYAALGDACEALWDLFGEDGRQTVSDASLMAIVAQSLAVNYWGNLFTFAGLLGLFDTINIEEAAYAMLDKPRLDAYFAALGPEKKTLLLELSKSSGGSSGRSEILTQLLAN